VTARASSGESSIHRAADGRCHGYVSMGLKDNGRRDRRHVSGQRRADVVSKVRALEQKRDAGTVQAAGQSQTVRRGWSTGWSSSPRAGCGRPHDGELPVHGPASPRAEHRPPPARQLQPEHLEQMYGPWPPRDCRRRRRCGAPGPEPGAEGGHAAGQVARNVAVLVRRPQREAAESLLPLSAEEAALC
jgi:hypothetical protein